MVWARSPRWKTPSRVDGQPSASSPEWTERSEGNDVETALSREYAARVKAGTQGIYDGILTLIDKDAVRSVSTGEPKEVRFNMKCDDFRYLAEFAGNDAQSEAVEDARNEHAEATKGTEGVLVVTHPIHLSFGVTVSILLCDPDEAHRMA